jgi:hypothetical protein
MPLLANPLGCNMEKLPTGLKIEQVGLKFSDTMKERLKEEYLMIFYKCLQEEICSKLRRFSRGFICMSASTYLCGRGDFKMKCVKCTYRSSV